MMRARWKEKREIWNNIRELREQKREDRKRERGGALRNVDFFWIII